MKKPGFLRRICMRLIAFYRQKISRRKRAPTCKYYPSCSEYAYRAYETHGFLSASFLCLWRILRCNPFSRGGIDYVPGTPERAERQVDLWGKHSPSKIVYPRSRSEKSSPKSKKHTRFRGK